MTENEKTNDTPKMGFIGFLHTYKIKKNDINRIYRLNKLISKQSMNPNEILNNFPSNNQSHY